MIEDVEGIRTDLEIQRFTVVQLLHQREISVCIVRSVELVPRRIAEVGLGVIGDEIGSGEARRYRGTCTTVTGNVRIEEINERLATIEAATHIFTPKQKSISGVMIGIAFNGLT